MIEKGLELAKDDGIVYLGSCSSNYTDSTVTFNSIQYRRGVYYCSHAIAYTKWRARTLWGDYGTYRFLHNEFSIDKIARQWQLLSKTYPIHIAANVEWPQGKNHYGLFFQNRDRLNSSGLL